MGWASADPDGETKCFSSRLLQSRCILLDYLSLSAQALKFLTLRFYQMTSNKSNSILQHSFLVSFFSQFVKSCKKRVALLIEGLHSVATKSVLTVKSHLKIEVFGNYKISNANKQAKHLICKEKTYKYYICKYLYIINKSKYKK